MRYLKKEYKVKINNKKVNAGDERILCWAHLVKQYGVAAETVYL